MIISLILLIIVVHIKICMNLIHDLDYLFNLDVLFDLESYHFDRYYMQCMKIVATPIKLSLLSLSSSTLNVYNSI